MASPMPDPIGVIFAVGFIVVGLLVIPINDILEARRLKDRRNQAHRRNKGDHS